jgi:hypothetical protein
MGARSRRLAVSSPGVAKAVLFPFYRALLVTAHALVSKELFRHTKSTGTPFTARTSGALAMAVAHGGGAVPARRGRWSSGGHHRVFALTRNVPCSRRRERRSSEGRGAPLPAIVTVPWGVVEARLFHPLQSPPEPHTATILPP